MNRRVLFLTDGLANGGAERQLALLIKYLPAEWSSRVIAFGYGPFAEIIRAQGIRVDLCLRRWQLDVSPSLFVWRTIADWRPDIVHGWGWMGLAAAMPLCTLLRIPTIGTIRTGKVQSIRGHWGGTLYKIFVGRAARIIANSEFGLANSNLATSRGRVIYNGFDPERLKLCPASARKPGHVFSVGMVARMEPIKDYGAFFDAARQIVARNEISEWRFRAIGTGTMRTQWINDNDDLIQTGVLTFPESGTEVLPQVRDTNVGVLMTRPGIAEGCSNALMEYMACGLPVVCSDSGGNRELVMDGETGFIIPPRDVNALVEKLVWLKEHPAQAAQMGQAGRERILTHFSVDQMVEKTIAVYSEVM